MWDKRLWWVHFTQHAFYSTVDVKRAAMFVLCVCDISSKLGWEKNNYASCPDCLRCPELNGNLSANWNDLWTWCEDNYLWSNWTIVDQQNSVINTKWHCSPLSHWTQIPTTPTNIWLLSPMGNGTISFLFPRSNDTAPVTDIHLQRRLQWQLSSDTYNNNLSPSVGLARTPTAAQLFILQGCFSIDSCTILAQYRTKHFCPY